MISLILRTIARYLMPLLFLFSVFLLLRGHNEPGGGFVGGLVAASALALYALAYDAAEARRVLGVEPRLLIGAGLLLALGSGGIALLSGEPFLTGKWGSIAAGDLGRLDIGTPLLFDIGVYLVVQGAALTFILTLAEE